MTSLSYRGHRFPAPIIQHAIWLYIRFTLSYRDVEELLAERGLDLSYETIRRWVLKFGPLLARRLRQRRQALYVSISDAQRAPLPNAHWAGTVYHGIPEYLVKPSFAPEGYLAFLGRICPEKGPETAIELARAANLPLKIAAKVDKVDQAYFESRVKPLIDG